MIEYTGKIFHTLEDQEGSLQLGDLSIHDSDFFNCVLSNCASPALRSRVKNVEVRKCRLHNNYFGPAALENILLEDLRSDNLVIIWGALFEKVVLRGRICDIKINASPLSRRSEKNSAEFDKDRLKFYETCEWAIDIREAKLNSFDCLGIPAHKILIDAKTQVVIKKELILESKSIIDKMDDNYWSGHIDFLLGSAEETMVLAVPLRAPKKEREKSAFDLERLRDAGAAI